MHFLRQARGKSPIGKSPSDYEAWKPSRRAHGALRAGGDSFRSVDEGAGSSSSSSSSLLRKIRSPDNCDLSSREGSPKRGGKRNGARREKEEEKGTVERQYPRILLLVSIPRIFSKVHLGLAALIRNIN